MTLREREALEATQIRLLIPPLPSIFLATATQVLTKAVKTPTKHYETSLTGFPAVDNLHKSLVVNAPSRFFINGDSDH